MLALVGVVTEDGFLFIDTEDAGHGGDLRVKVAQFDATVTAAGVLQVREGNHIFSESL